MDCPPNILNYVYTPTSFDLSSLSHKFVAVGAYRTMFYCERGKFYRFDVIGHSRTYASLMGGVITAFIIDQVLLDGKLVNSQTMCERTITEQLKSDYVEKVSLNGSTICNLEKITILSDESGKLTTFPDILPSRLVYKSAYYDDMPSDSKIYLDHQFYNDTVNKYGYLNDLTLLVYFLADQTTTKKITIDKSVPPEICLELFRIHDKASSICAKLCTDTIRERIKPAYHDYLRYLCCDNVPSLGPPSIMLPACTISYPSRKKNSAFGGFSPLCICCHITNASQYNELMLRLVEIEFIVGYDLIVTVNDLALQPQVQKMFPDAMVMYIPINGEDIGGFLQALNYVYSGDKRYRYIMKMHFNEPYQLRSQSLGYIQSEILDHIRCLDESPQLNMVGTPVVKFDFLNMNYLLKYIKRYRIKHNMPTASLHKLLTDNDQQVVRQSGVWQGLSRKTVEKYVPSGNFICRLSILYENMIDSYDDLSAKTNRQLNDAYSKQFAEFAWVRLFGIIAGTIKGEN